MHLLVSLLCASVTLKHITAACLKHWDKSQIQLMLCRLPPLPSTPVTR
jgi:hypothetical protein